VNGFPFTGLLRAISRSDGREVQGATSGVYPALPAAYYRQLPQVRPSYLLFVVPHSLAGQGFVHHVLQHQSAP
jgi:hypothetical protein